MGTRTRHRSDAGDTLLEILISVAILGIAVTAVLGLMQMSVRGSDIHRTHAVAGSILGNFAEFMLNQNKVPYELCPAAKPTYEAKVAEFEGLLKDPTSTVYEPAFTRPSGTPAYKLTVTTDLGNWAPRTDPSDPSVKFVTPCGGGSETNSGPGLQQLTLTVAYLDSASSESTVVVKRAP
jgi:type II secretory pathway pseudopilin PulG